MSNPPPPPMPPRMSQPRSSFAMAMKDYTFIRPGIAVTISSLTLVAALIFGIFLIRSLRRAAAAVDTGARTSEILHKYNAKWEVYLSMASGTGPEYKRPEVIAQRDSLRNDLQDALHRLGARPTTTETERGMISQILLGLTTTQADTIRQAREALVVILANQDQKLFDAAQESQQGVVLAAVLLALTILAASLMLLPMAWLYVRFKRGTMIEVKL